MQQAGMASSESSSGCQSGWTTYLDDDEEEDRSSSRSSGGTKRQFHFHAKAAQQPHYHCHDYCSEEDDLSMISDASSGPRHQCSAVNDDVVQAGAANSAAERRARRVADAASARRQSKKAAAAALLEDTASSPAFFGYSKSTSLFAEANAYGADADEAMMEIGNAADFSCAFSATTTTTTTTTGFKSSFNGTALDGYLQMQYSPAAAKPTMMPTMRQVCRDAGETNTSKRW